MRLLTLEFACLLAAAAPISVAAQYTWKNVKFGGGGGFVPGIVFNPTQKGVVYARTDIGGLYKLNSDDSWTPLTDAIAHDKTWHIKRHNWGVDAVATDPIDPARVYAALGMYTHSWDPDNGAIARSSDGGATWSTFDLPFKVGGNMPGRGMGERLAIDPNNNHIIYFGARSGNGLWKSTNQGQSFEKVTSFTSVGTYVADPNDSSGYNSDIQGLAWIEFDSTSALVGGATSRIFVGVADKGESVFYSEDAGQTWSAVPNQPQGFLPHKGKFQPSEKALYLTYSDTSGPYDGGNGTVQRFDIASSTWTDITPVSGEDLFFGFGGLALDMQKPGTLMVVTLNLWWPDAQIYRSVDSGKTWSVIWEWGAYPDRTLYYDYSTPKAPWIITSRGADDTKELGWMIESLEINPLDSNHWLYGTGLTIYGGHDLTNWDTTHKVTIESLADGIEETSVQALASVPGGPALLSATGDVGGYTHDNDLTKSPEVAWINPSYATNTGVDYAGNKPQSAVRVGNSGSEGNQIAVSSDGGKTWAELQGGVAGTSGGKVALSADADSALWSASSGVVVVRSGSQSQVTSLPTGAAIASDKRNGTVFYAGHGNRFFLSVDSGSTFTSVSTLGSAQAVRDVVVNPTLAGDVWVSTDDGIFHSTDYGKTFKKTDKSVTDAYALALGKGPGKYWNVYGVISRNGSPIELFMSNDTGKNWNKIQGTRGFGAAGGIFLAASKDTSGLVFVGTNGRGAFYGLPG
ncbi:hypothetical protein AJ80_02889 [Polytolypa hystricis UAMH7299]|uniref:Xyloglucanase n=1 Tax=Polytolypa hystricis (strain UAMH7299) TaxID=1447883 RepID=A0A2B7YFX1_POLH7|nr:hypothetical protein AJ80_02889 [Polytolypa hystricis UAMH7299]